MSDTPDSLKVEVSDEDVEKIMESWDWKVDWDEPEDEPASPTSSGSNESRVMEKWIEKEKLLKNKDFDTLCISGGGVKGLSILGCLHHLYIEGYLDKIKTYIGTSVGSIISYLLIIGYSPIEIFTQVHINDVSEDFRNLNLIQLLSDYGICQFHNNIMLLMDMSRQKMGMIPSLKQLYERTGKILICTVYNYTKMRTEYFNYLSHPELSCLEAVKISSSMPLIFPRHLYQGNLYIDGGISDNYPIDYVDDGKNKILGITLDDSHMLEGKEKNVLEYIYRLLMIPLQMRKDRSIRHASERAVTIKVRCDKVGFVEFHLSKRTKMDLFSNGYHQAKNWVMDKIKQA